MPILICHDGSPTAKQAISVARATLAGDHVILLHVWSPPLAFLADAFSDPGVLPGPTIEDLERFALDRAQEIAQEGQQLARADGLTVETRVERSENTVWRTILDVAEDRRGPHRGRHTRSHRRAVVSAGERLGRGRPPLGATGARRTGTHIT